MQKVSQEELAFRSNLDRTFISMLERGIHQPTLNSLLAIDAAMDMNAAELVGLVEDEMENYQKIN